MYLSNGEIEEPFKIYYDALSSANGRSRIDYYGGTVSTYQLSHEGEYGKMYRIIPRTTFEETNKRTCYQADAKNQGDEDNSDGNDENVENDNNNTDQENGENEESSDDENRIEVTDQTVVTDENEDTTNQNIVTETYENSLENEIGAKKARGDNDDVEANNKRIKPQTVLPNCGNFKYDGMEKIKVLVKIANSFDLNKKKLQALTNCLDGHVTNSY